MDRPVGLRMLGLQVVVVDPPSFRRRQMQELGPTGSQIKEREGIK